MCRHGSDNLAVALAANNRCAAGGQYAVSMRWSVPQALQPAMRCDMQLLHAGTCCPRRQGPCKQTRSPAAPVCVGCLGAIHGGVFKPLGPGGFQVCLKGGCCQRHCHGQVKPSALLLGLGQGPGRCPGPPTTAPPVTPDLRVACGDFILCCW
jgi:hypothetical protein